MKLPIEESDFVFCDVQDIVRYSQKRNPVSAISFLQAFQVTISQISEMPHLGRPRPDLGTPEVRSWRVGGWRRYLIFYEVLPDRVRLLRVLHGARDLQAELNK